MNINFEKIQELFLLKKPMVWYRHPQHSQVHGMVQRDRELFSTYQLDGKEGFVFAPYNSDEPIVLLPKSQSDEFVVDDIVFTDASKKGRYMGVSKSFSQNQTAQDYQNRIAKTIDFLEQANVDKIVMSRVLPIDYKYAQHDALYLFSKMLKRYKDAYVYIWSHPKVGIWLGATPELLLSLDHRDLFTMSLAGTQQFDSNYKSSSTVPSINWGDKEKQEQALVTKFITDNLSTVSQQVTVTKPYTHYVGAKSLAHLRTDITAVLDSDITLSHLVSILHPTPAVCGVPIEQAKKYISLHEDYKRYFYTGFLGMLTQKKAYLRVNLRCMQLSVNDRIFAYVGGGITKDSCPEKEWQETVAKTHTMCSILDK